MSAIEIAEMEAQLAALKKVQSEQASAAAATDDDEAARIEAMTPRGGGAAAVRALRKASATVEEDESSDAPAPGSEAVKKPEALASVPAEDENKAAGETPEGIAAVNATEGESNEDTPDEIDLALYADNGYFPSYVAKEGGIEEQKPSSDSGEASSVVGNADSQAPPNCSDPNASSSSEGTEASETGKGKEEGKDKKKLEIPENWIAKRTPGKFGRTYWENTETGDTHYNENPPTAELLAELAAKAISEKAAAAEAAKKRKEEAEAAQAEVDRLWKAKREAEKAEQARLKAEKEAERKAAAAKKPAWKVRLEARKAAKAKAAAAAKETPAKAANEEENKENVTAAGSTNPKSPKSEPQGSLSAPVLSSSNNSAPVEQLSAKPATSAENTVNSTATAE